MKAFHLISSQSNDLNEIIFAYRNKNYGAYVLRKYCNDRLLKAFGITLSSIIIFFTCTTLIQLHSRPLKKDSYSLLAEPDTLSVFEIIPKKIHAAEPATKPAHASMPLQITDNSVNSSLKIADTMQTASAVGDSAANDEMAAGQGKSVYAAIGDSMQGNDPPEADTFSFTHEVYPSFPGGNKEFSRYVQNNFDCSTQNVSGYNEDGKIILRFIVRKDGVITRVEVLKNNAGLNCENEAVELLQNSPRWNPGLQNNQPVNVLMLLPIMIQKQ
ncbi:MAG: energy transducer TonB [Chitinophagales bacterium]